MIVQLPAPAPLAWRIADDNDGERIAELRAEVLRDSLERLGRYDEARVREYFLAGYAPERTYALHGPDGLVGSLALRPAPEGTWIEHFYLHPRLQGRGFGASVLAAITSAADSTGTMLWLIVLCGSDARRLYERHGFRLDHEEPVDVCLRRPPHEGDR